MVKNDLANVFLERCLELSQDQGAGVVQIVMPQNWLFLTCYKRQREALFKSVQWNLLVRLGMAAFEVMDWWAFNVILLTQTRTTPSDDFRLRGLDTSEVKGPQDKANLLRDRELVSVGQRDQLLNPDFRLVLAEGVSSGARLSDYVEASQGISPGDTAFMRLSYWEVESVIGQEWLHLQSTPEHGLLFSGCNYVLRNPSIQKCGDLNGFGMCGERAWGRPGVVIGKMASLPVNVYSGKPFDANCPVLVVKEEKHAAVRWAGGPKRTRRSS